VPDGRRPWAKYWLQIHSQNLRVLMTGQDSYFTPGCLGFEFSHGYHVFAIDTNPDSGPSRSENWVLIRLRVFGGFCYRL
jgi:hypothetical protein